MNTPALARGAALFCAAALTTLFAATAPCTYAQDTPPAAPSSQTALVTPVIPAPPLREIATTHGFGRIGTCANVGLLRAGADEGRYPAAIARDYSIVEPENELKPPAVWRGPGQYDWTNADFLLGAPGQTGWAQAHKVAVRGHVLVYARDDGYTLPSWLRASEADITPAQAREMLHTYIKTVVGRYRGKIVAWDVVNEAIDDNGASPRPFHLRDSFWFRKLGTDFLKLAFQWAHEADPTAELYLNEYGAEGMGRKSDDVLAILTWLKESGIYVTGAGMQYHLFLRDRIAPGDAHYQNAARLQAAGFAFMVTELDVALPVADSGTGYVAAHPADLDVQADRYRAVLHLARTSPNCRGLLVWGVSDNHSWIPGFSKGNGAATPSDSAYQPKPAYRAMQAELESSVLAAPK